MEKVAGDIESLLAKKVRALKVRRWACVVMLRVVHSVLRKVFDAVVALSSRLQSNSYGCVAFSGNCILQLLLCIWVFSGIRLSCRARKCGSTVGIFWIFIFWIFNLFPLAC